MNWLPTPASASGAGHHSCVSLGSELRQIREWHGWNRSDLAKRADISHSSIKRMEDDAIVPHPATIRRMLNALVLHPDGIGLDEAVHFCGQLAIRWNPPSTYKMRAFESQIDVPKGYEVIDTRQPTSVSTEFDVAGVSSVVELALRLVSQVGVQRATAALEGLVKSTVKAKPIPRAPAVQPEQQLRSISAPITRPDGATEQVIRTYDVARIPPPAPAKKKAN